MNEELQGVNKQQAKKRCNEAMFLRVRQGMEEREITKRMQFAWEYEQGLRATE
jgi:hypothetical protein